MDKFKQQLLIDNYEYIKKDIVYMLSKKYFSVDIDEIESIAMLTATEATLNYNKDKLNYRKYIKLCIERKIIDIIKSKKHKIEITKETKDINHNFIENFENEIINKDIVKIILNADITEKQRKIINTILVNPELSNNGVAKSLNLYNVQIERELQKLKKYV